MQTPSNMEKECFSSIAPHKSRLRRFLSSKTNLATVLICFALIIVLAFILGFVTVPGFEEEGASEHISHYAVVPENFPDPSFIQSRSDPEFYAFGIRDAHVHVQVASGSNISSWTLRKGYDALPDPGAWTTTSINDTQVWAPSVTSTIAGQYIMFYSALHQNQTRRHCVGAATSSTIAGPYTALPSPIVCDFSHGGVIDPAYFHDPGTNASYLIYKRDGNAIGVGGACSDGNRPNTPAPLMALELSSTDLITAVGRPFELLSNIQTDGPNIESPMIYYYEYTTPNGTSRVRTYHLMYNSGCYHDRSYRIDHIVCIPSESAFWSTGIRGCFWQEYRSETADCAGNCTTYSAGTILDSYADVGVGNINHAALFTLEETNPELLLEKTKIKLAAPGGPAVGVCNTGGLGGSIGSGNYYKQYLAFHADTNLDFTAGWYGSALLLLVEVVKRAPSSAILLIMAGILLKRPCSYREL